MTQAAVWTPPEFQNKSIKIPNKKLEASKPLLLPFTGYKIMNRI